MTETQNAEDSVDAPTVIDSPAASADASSVEVTSESVGTDEAEAEVSDQDEADIAADYIEELLDICDIDGDIDIEVRAGRSYISVHSDDPEDLELLSKPDTVTALQELTRLTVQSSTGEFSRLILDIGGSREARQRELADLVDRAIGRLDEGAEQASLPAMSSYERKLVHDLVKERGYVSNSEGEGRDRHTVITASA